MAGHVKEKLATTDPIHEIYSVGGSQNGITFRGFIFVVAWCPEVPMIELTPEQQLALDPPAQQPAVAVDPRTGQEYLLIRREIYELVRGTLKPYGRGWDDDPDMDEYEQYRKKP